jgi:peptidoglycan/xylan/chitin deacetylase (PgdA/CDA1 family)
MSHPRTTEPFSTSSLLAEAEPARPVRRSPVFYVWVAFFFTAKAATLALLWFHHYGWAVAVFFLPAPWYAYQILKPAARGLGPVVTRFATQNREVWLTIDDGPDPESTPKVLALLEAHGARATFFLIGEKAQRHPELVAEILRHGHTIGNHTQTHPHRSFWLASAKRTAAEIDACAETLRAAGVHRTGFFRSPVGLKNHALYPLLAQRGLDLVLWSARGYDTICRDPAKVIARITASLRPGVIILLHENGADPAVRSELFNQLFADLSRKGYTCVLPSAKALIREG